MNTSLSKRVETLSDIFVEKGLPWFEENYPEGSRVQHPGELFSFMLVIWLMVSQKGTEGNSLSAALQALRRIGSQGKGLEELAGNSKKVRFGDISSNPSGYCHARKKLNCGTVNAFSDYLSEKVDVEHKDLSTVGHYKVFLLDGSTIELQNTKEIRDQFAPASNQYGMYRPQARIVVAHNAGTGTAYRPEIGSLNQSEQELCIPLLQRLPKKSLVIADRNFGVFSVAWHLLSAKQVPLVRLQKERAYKILGKYEINSDEDTVATWSPSKNDREATPSLPEDANIKGRVIAITLEVPGRRTERLFFFTTARALTPQEILAAYKLRWFIETDLRSIKQTVQLDTINSKSPNVVRNEITLGVVAYTLLRALIARGAKKINLNPREISFTRARDYIVSFSVRIQKAQNEQELQMLLDKFPKGFGQMKHPKRTKFRSEPRSIVGRLRNKFPPMKGTRDEARQAALEKRLQGVTQD